MEILRLDKMLADCGLGTRSDVKKLIKQGKVSVDGIIVKKAETKINTKINSVIFNGNKILYEKYIYLVMNKPPGVISATEDRKEKTVIDLLEEKYKNTELFPVGRLDKDTVGLLILTNDGAFAHNTLSPKKHIEKEYYAVVNGEVTLKDVELFKNGIKIDGGDICKSASLNIIKSSQKFSEITIKITEGKFHQIKRMFKAINKEVIFLKRVAFGELKLDNSLKEGEYRPLTDDEYNLLKKFMKGDN